MRHLLLWAVLFAVYAGTSGLHTVDGSRYGVEEAHHLLTSESLSSDGDLDISDEAVAPRAPSAFPADLRIHGYLVDGRIHDPHGVGFPLAISPVLALGGPLGVELLLAGVMALAFTIAAGLASVVVPQPWASRGVAVVALSPPAVAHATLIHPDGLAALLLVIAVAFAIRAREDARLPLVAASALAMAPLPWLGPEYLVPAAPVAVLLVSWTLRQHRRFTALTAVEILGVSLIAYTAVNEALYGGLTPLAIEIEHRMLPDPSSPAAFLERAPLLAGIWLDRDFGLVRWAPVLALAFFGIWLLWRSRRDALARMLPERRSAEGVAGLAAAVFGALLIVAVAFNPEAPGDVFPGRHLVASLPLAAILVAWSTRHLPHLALGLSALTLLTTAWLVVGLRAGWRDAWAPPTSSVPWGPLEHLLPSYYATTSGWTEALTLALAAVLLVVVAVEWRTSRSWRGTADSRRRV